MVGMKKRVLKRGGGSAMKKRLNRGGDVDMIKKLSLIHISRCRRLLTCRSRWSPYH